MYRATHALADLECVDSDLGCSTIIHYDWAVPVGSKSSGPPSQRTPHNSPRHLALYVQPLQLHFQPHLVFPHSVDDDVDPLELPLGHAALLPLARQTPGNLHGLLLGVVVLVHERHLHRLCRIGRLRGGQLLLGARLHGFVLLRRPHLRDQLLVLVQLFLQFGRRL